MQKTEIMNNQAEAALNSTIPMEEVTRMHLASDGKYFEKPGGTLLTDANNDLVRFNGYYGLNITDGNHKGAEGAFFTIDTNMWVTTTNQVSTAEYYLQFIVSLDGKTSVKIPFTGTFTKLTNGDGYRLQQTAQGVGGMNQVDLDLTFTRSQSVTTADVNGTITVAAPGQGQSTVSGSTYNNPILPTTYIGTYYDKKQEKTLEICKDHVLNYRVAGGSSLQRIEKYRFNLNMYVFAFPAPDDSNATISLVMGTSPASGLVCGNLRTINDDKNASPTSRTLNTIKAPVKPPKMSLPNINSDKVAPFAAYYPTPTAEFPNAFIAIQAARIPLAEDVNIFEVTIGISTDGITSAVYNFDGASSFDTTTNTLSLANPAHTTDPLAPKYAAVIKFEREYIQGGKSGTLITLKGSIMGKEITPAHTPFNLIPLEGFSGAVLKNEKGETLVVNNNNVVTYKGKQVGLGHPERILYIPIMYILEFTNPEPPKDEIAGMDYKVVCSWGTDAAQGLACIVTEYTLEGNTLINQAISYYHSVPKQG
ncbi:MAG: hypothetical protein NXI10_16830 [bacterium]|nr:hypothetical protein [bacterium]